MSKDSILDYSATASENQDIGGISILGTAKPSNLDDGFRMEMSHIAKGLVTRRLEKDTAYTAVKADHNQLIDFTEAATMTTASAATLTDGWMCYVYASGGDVTINPNGSETVNGEETAVVSEGNRAVLRVYDGNFLLDFYVGGGGSSQIIYEESGLVISSSTYLTITDIPDGLRALDLDLSISGISANPGTATLLASIGDGANWFEFGSSSFGYLTQWTNSGTAARSLTARISCLDDEDLPVTLASVNNNLTPNTISVDVCQPDELTGRPVTTVRIRLQTQSGTANVNYRKVRLRGIYA